MDPAVALVQAYLQLNGYLTVTEFPIVDAEGAEAITDVDLIALRFPGARPFGLRQRERGATDAVLSVGDEGMDLLVCEVKEGKARLNANLLRKETLGAALRRVGCCPEHHIAHHVDDLLRGGQVIMDHPGFTCRARIAVFAGRAGYGHPAALVVSLAHVAREVSQFLHEHAVALRAVHLTQPALAQLWLLTKLGVLGPADVQSAARETQTHG